MSEPEDRKAKAARAKALVRIPLNEFQILLFLTSTTAEEAATSNKV
jgi:hypothetical protein